MSLLSLIIFIPLLATEMPFITIGQKNFLIYYESPDSIYAKTALNILSRAEVEISHDLHIPSLDTFHIILAPSRSYFQQYIQGSLPKWTDGFIISDKKLMVVKSPRWDRPEANFAQTLIHELLHLVLNERIGRTKIPRWLHEGLAQFYAEENEKNTKTALSKAVFTRSLISLNDIDNVLDYKRQRADLAYQESYFAVHYLLSTYDIEALNIILDGIKSNQPLNDSFKSATGSTFDEFEKEWTNYLEKTQKWFWLSDFYDFLWFLISALFIITIFLIRRRNRRKIAEWDAESVQSSDILENNQQVGDLPITDDYKAIPSGENIEKNCKE